MLEVGKCYIIKTGGHGLHPEDEGKPIMIVGRCKRRHIVEGVRGFDYVGFIASCDTTTFGEVPEEYIPEDISPVEDEDEFAQVLDFTQQPKYKNGSGDDFVAEFARDNSPERFQGAMIFIIEKYLKRLGKKDDIVQELYKVADYANRFYQIEKERNEDK